ncbi:MAG: plasmid recombination protein [Bacteroidaceae bacterium]|nr:plasmid recombination protein [Bacteroidaceae bacterium]
MAEKKQTQVCDIQASKGVPRSLSNEHLRNFSQKAYEGMRSANFDPTREHLDFEVAAGGKIVPLDKKNDILKRIKANLKSRGILDPNEGKEKPNVRTAACIILNGSTDTMRKLAFGNQEVNWERGADNSAIERMPEIERWAQDMYHFMSHKYGEENIASFVVHLDESNPHIHCILLPITSSNKFSWKEVFVGKDKFEYSQRMKVLHDELAEVNKKWGLERGDPVALTGANHKSMQQYLLEKNEELTHTNTHLTSVNASLCQLPLKCKVELSF